MEFAAGVTPIEDKLADVIVRDAVAVNAVPAASRSDAVMVVLPAATPAATPEELIDAIPPFAEAHVTWLVMLTLDPFAYLPMA